MSRFPRDIIAAAYPGQPRMQRAFEDLVGAFEEALDKLETASQTASGAAGDATTALDGLDSRQPKNALLTAISGLPASVGAIEITGAGIVAVRPIDAPDTKSLVSREVADSRYLGRGGTVAAASGLTSTHKVPITLGGVSYFVLLHT